MTSRNAVVSHIAEMFWVVVYAACMPMPSSEVMNPMTQLTHRSPRTPWSSPASPDTVRRKTMPPSSTSTDPNASARVSPNAMPTPWFVSFCQQPGHVATGGRADGEREGTVDRMRVRGHDLPVDDIGAVCQRGQRGDHHGALVAVLRVADSLYGLAAAREHPHAVLRDLHPFAERERDRGRRLPGRIGLARRGIAAVERGVRERRQRGGEEDRGDDPGREEEPPHAASGGAGAAR